MSGPTVSVIGGDERMLYTVKKLKELGYTLNVTGFENSPFPLPFAPCPLFSAVKAPFLLFGLPLTRDGKTLLAPFSQTPISIDEIIKGLSPGQKVLGGNLGQQKERFEAGGAKVFDYFLDEELTLINACLTAEALVSILIEALPRSLSGAEIALVGYGRIGKYLSHMLKPFGADVTVFARRKEAREEAKTAGNESEPISGLSANSHRFHALVNTVPSPCIGKSELEKINGDCVLIEAASPPYGIDFTLCAEKGFRLIKAFSLPGKYSPLSAGEQIALTADKLISGGDTDA